MVSAGKKHLIVVRSNVRLARTLWGHLSTTVVKHLRELTTKYRLSVAAGDLQLLHGRWYVTHAGLLRIAERRRCTGIRTSVDRRLSDTNSNRWVFKATAYTHLARKVSSATATPIPRTCLPWSAGPRCAWPRPAPSIAPSAKLTASACVRSKSLDPSLRPRHLRIPSRPRLFLATEMVRVTASPDCGTNSAF